MKRGDRRGVALIFVLWLLIVLGAIASEVASRARLEAEIVASVRARAAARYAAESGILAARVEIETLLDSAPGLPERVAVFRGLKERLASLGDVDLGSARFGVAVVDLNARIDLNRADDATLQGLFRQFTTDKRAEEDAAALRRAPVYRLAELAHVPGVDDSLALAVAPYVTVWSDGIVDINSAPEPVLAALPGVSVAVARSVVRRRDAGEVFLTTDPVRSQAFVPPPQYVPPGAAPGALAVPSLPPLAVTPSRLMIVSRGWADGHPLTHEIRAVYAVLGSRLALQAWQERDL